VGLFLAGVFVLFLCPLLEIATLTYFPQDLFERCPVLAGMMLQGRSAEAECFGGNS
jgi:hypothetical protein